MLEVTLLCAGRGLAGGGQRCLQKHLLQLSSLIGPPGAVPGSGLVEGVQMGAAVAYFKK